MEAKIRKLACRIYQESYTKFNKQNHNKGIKEMRITIGKVKQKSERNLRMK